ncbi:hypothetical protein [Pseudomonas sp. NPDC089406]|uniref:hypothetical protein n=1 Tax=Pseudomonas sp. NPDC089406 TaxID=3364463 RepID=UPI00384AD6F5
MTPSALFRALEDNSRQAEQQLREAEQALYAGSDQQARLEHQIACKLGEIASLQLQDTAALDLQTRQQLEQREQAQAALLQTLQQAERIIANTLGKHHAARQNLEQLDARAQDLLEQNPASRQLLEQLEAARQAEQHAHAGYEEIRSECDSKLHGYTSNPLYTFLKARQYGTEHYRPYPLQGMLDNYLARRVDFHTNQANERILLSMQARNETVRQARSEAHAQLQAQYQQQLDEARQALGMQNMLAEEQVLNTLLKESKARASSLQVQLSEFSQQRDPHLLGIRQTITERLKARPLAELMLAAAQTPDTRDDLLVSELQVLHARLEDAGQALKTLQNRAQNRRQHYERAKAIEHGLRTEHYQDSRHEYQLRHPIEQILAEYMRGAADQQAIEKLLDEGREYVAPRHRGNGRSSSSYSSGGFSGGSSSSGFRTSSSSGGGGFRTTDSF